MFSNSNWAAHYFSIANLRARDLCAIVNCLVLMDLLVELPLDDEKFVRRDLALAWELAAKSMSGSSRAEARDALALAEISNEVLGRGVPSSDPSRDWSSSSSRPNSASTQLRKSSKLANCVVAVHVLSSNVDWSATREAL